MGSTHARHGVWLHGGALVLALVLSLGAGCRSREAGPAPAAETSAATSGEPATAAPGQRPAAPAFADVAADLAPLRARFQEDDGRVRVIMLVAPT